MSAPDTVRNLVERFERNHEQYRAGKYNETQLRREFLDPFFEALGWDVFNKQGYAETYKDVIHEDSLEIEGATKAPDYAFRVGGQRKFFVEAKKPSVNIENNIYPAFQLRRYAWSAKLPLGILTDFQEFAVYDCRVKPDKGDKASVGRVMLLSYKDYIEKWDELVAIFSRDAVLKGSFDSYAEGMKAKKGTTEVDDAFLGEIERWRDLLAKNIALRNQSLSVRELNYAVQMTIDRIVFLRICEDRGVERDEQLKEIASGDEIYKGLVQLFQRADARYNSGLFHFTAEKNESSPADSLTLGLTVDDRVLRDILLNLYYPDSPYVFREIPSDILGQVYERFLGKVIRLTAGHQAKVEEKPEVRKAGGVYYTPTYIVNYIVQNTVGKLLEGKTPKDAEKLRILDPACGSGTFPLGAYQYLLDWHLDWYINHDPEKIASGKNPAIFQSKDGWLLTTSKKKEILLNNIYGVDIDAQAVEVTKLSLLLKVLEGESQETIGSQLSLLQERVLPDLSKNIQCGNSLIGPDYYEGHQLTMGFGDDEERYRVNAFDWKGAFPQVFIHGGFDAVIGNPPYIDIIGIPPDQRTYFQKTYETFLYRSDILSVFFHKAIEVLCENGYVSFITSNTYFSSSSATKLRSLMAEKLRIERIIDLGGGVFSQANVDTAIFISQKRTPENSDTVYISACKSLSDFKYVVSKMDQFTYSVPQSQFALNDGTAWVISSGANTDKLVSRIGALSPLLDSCAEFSRGYIAYDAHRGHSQQMIENRVFHTDHKKTDKHKKELLGSDIGRYSIGIKSNLWIEFGKNLAAPRDKRFHEGKRIWIQRIRNPKLTQRLVCFYVEGYEDLAASSGISILRKTSGDWELKAICGLLNSRFINWWFRQLFHDVNIKPADMERIPLPNINFSDSAEKAKHDKLAALVEKIQSLQNQPTTRTPQEQEMVKREIESTDRAIDKLVYELYGLTEEEIKIVEGK